MTATTATSATTHPPSTSYVARTVAPVQATTIADTFKAEWTKLRTLRSTWYTVAGAVVTSVGLAALICLAQVSQWDKMSAKEQLAFDPTSTALIGVFFASVILGTLAVRAITSEYSSGLIRVTFSAIPGRKGVLAAKAAILASLAFPVALVTNLLCFFTAQQVLSAKHISMSLSQSGVIRAIVFGAVTVSLVTVFGLGLGAIIRRTAGATTALMVALIGSGIFGIALPESARQYLPGTAMQAVTAVKHASGLLPPTTALAVVAGYAVVAVTVATRLISRRDA